MKYTAAELAASRRASDEAWAMLQDRFAEIEQIARDGIQSNNDALRRIIIHVVLGELLFRAAEARG